MSEKKNIFLITIDALRADHLNCYGYEKRETSPFLDSLAEKGMLFKNCYSTGCFTSPSFCSILGGGYPLQYGTHVPLPDEITTLAEVFKDEGFFTVGYHSNPYLSKIFGYDRGFDVFEEFGDEHFIGGINKKMIEKYGADSLLYKICTFAFHKIIVPVWHIIPKGNWRKKTIYKTAKDIKKGLLKILNKNKPEKTFCWAHFMDVHNPYVPPNGKGKSLTNKRISKLDDLFLRGTQENVDASKKDIEDLQLIYDLNIKYIDEHLKDFFEKLPEKYKENSLFIITADHGELFKEHGYFGHDQLPYDELLHVPLIVFGEGIDSEEKEALVSSIDIPTTILSVAGIEPPADYRGKNLLKDERKFVVCQELKSKKSEDLIRNWHALNDLGYQREKMYPVTCYRDEKYKCIYSRKEKLMFDLEEDPEEKNNIFDEEKCEEFLEKVESEVSMNKTEAEKRRIKSVLKDLDV